LSDPSLAESIDDLNGADLKTIDNVIRWLSHPSNWSEIGLFIIKWDKTVPKLSHRSAYMIAPQNGESDLKFFASAVLSEQSRLKGRMRKGLFLDD
jgi:hypothetical protein